MEKFREYLKVIFKYMNGKNVPIVSGAASLFFLRSIVLNDKLDFSKYWAALLTVCVLFITSAILFYFLSKLEKEKDVSVLENIQKIVESVFEKYGTAKAQNNSSDSLTTEDSLTKNLNHIMQTIVDLTKELRGFLEKKYREL